MLLYPEETLYTACSVAQFGMHIDPVCGMTQDIQFVAYSSLGTQHQQVAPDNNPVLANRVVVGIADKHSASTAQIALRWGIQRGQVTTHAMLFSRCTLGVTYPS